MINPISQNLFNPNIFSKEVISAKESVPMDIIINSTNNYLLQNVGSIIAANEISINTTDNIENLIINYTNNFINLDFAELPGDFQDMLKVLFQKALNSLLSNTKEQKPSIDLLA